MSRLRGDDSWRGARLSLLRLPLRRGALCAGGRARCRTAGQVAVRRRGHELPDPRARSVLPERVVAWSCVLRELLDHACRGDLYRHDRPRVARRADRRCGCLPGRGRRPGDGDSSNGDRPCLAPGRRLRGPIHSRDGQLRRAVGGDGQSMRDFRLDNYDRCISTGLSDLECGRIYLDY